MNWRRIKATVLVMGIALSLLLYLNVENDASVTNISVIDPAVQARVAQEMQKRRQHLKQVCQNQSLRSEAYNIEDLVAQPEMLNHIIVNDQHKTLYCYVPKVACGNWKALMLLLEDGYNMQNLIARIILKVEAIVRGFLHDGSNFFTLSNFGTDDIRHRLQNYTKFLIVRHPLERTLSAFRNKLVINTSNAAGFKKNYGVHIIKNYREGVKPEEVPASGEGVTFSEYVSYVTDNKPEQLNEHWAPASTLCLPCSVSYDMIGKYETLVRDSEYILEQIGAPPSLHFPEHVATKTIALLDSYLATLTPLQLSRLLHLYQQDFINFDYHYQDMI